MCPFVPFVVKIEKYEWSKKIPTHSPEKIPKIRFSKTEQSSVYPHSKQRTFPVLDCLKGIVSKDLCMP
jgi:hypothetical protein